MKLPKRWSSLTREEFKELVDNYKWTRKITSCHMHHTYQPNHKSWQGAKSMQGMYDFHTGPERGWADIAQHYSVSPDGLLWPARDWNKAPISSAGYNGNSKSGPWMIETIGDFRAGHDVLEGNQLESVLFSFAYILHFHKLPINNKTVVFHKEIRKGGTSCPGDISKEWFVNNLIDYSKNVLPAYL